MSARLGLGLGVKFYPTKLNWVIEIPLSCLHKKLIDIDMVDQLMGWNILLVRATTMPLMEEMCRDPLLVFDR